MTAAETLFELRRLGVVLEVAGEKLLYRARKGVLTPDLRQAMSDNKPEIIESLKYDGRLAACSCDSAIPQRVPSCPLCKSSTRSQCGQCTAYRRGWDPGWTEPDMPDQPLPQLLERLRDGHRWLCEESEKFYDDPPSSASDELFGKMLAVWDDMEVAVRHVYEFGGCVLGQQRKCPAEGPVRCSACCPWPQEKLDE